MRMKKRLMGIILCTSVVAAAAGCAEKEQEKSPEETLDAAAIYEEAVEKNAGLDSLDMTSKTLLTMEMGEESMDMAIDMDMAVSGADTEQMKFTMDLNTDILGQNVETSMFYADGYYYMDMAGQKVKYPYEMEEAMTAVSQYQGGTISKDAMTKLTAKKDGENTVVEFEADPEKMNDYLGSVLANLQNSGIDESMVKIDKVNGSCTINPEGYYTANDVEMEMTITSGGTEIKTNMDMDLVINNPGEEVEVQLPDTSGYTEVDPSVLG